jgi:hypothetical protein
LMLIMMTITAVCCCCCCCCCCGGGGDMLTIQCELEYSELQYPILTTTPVHRGLGHVKTWPKLFSN